MTLSISKGLPRGIAMAFVMIFVVGTPRSTPMFAETAAGATPSDAKSGTTPPAGASKADAKATCHRYVAVLAGQKQDPALLHEAEVQSVARLAPDLTTCGAVARDSDGLCNLLDEPEKNVCRDNRALYHELRKPEKRASIFGDVEFESCRSNKELAQYCEALRTATRAGDPKKCPPGNLGAYCQAAIALDPSLCRFTGPKPEEAQRDCVKTIEKLKALAPGLKGLAQSGPSPDRELAKAALGQADGCAPFEQKATDACVANLIKPVESPTAGPPAASNPPTAQPATPGSK